MEIFCNLPLVRNFAQVERESIWFHQKLWPNVRMRSKGKSLSIGSVNAPGERGVC